MMKTVVFALLRLSSSITTVSAAVRSCYYPDGTTLSQDTPCNTTTTGHSACCTAPCMSSGLCFDNGLLSRGSYADQTWKDPACAPYCVDGTSGNPAIPTGGHPVIPREWTAGVDVAEIGWCCDFPIATGSCAQGREIKIAARAVLSNSTTAASALSATGTASGTATNTATSTAVCNAAGQSSGTNAGCPANHDVAIGVRIGAPLEIAVVSLLLLWLRERRARKKAVAEVLAYTQAPQLYRETKPAIYSGVPDSRSPASESGGTRDGRGAPSELGGGQRYGELP
ncbi:hypothetical protein BDZ45DRAFT_799601 [Acephala macrosclerotiorum]|nr:hypothetical protein BDZ45DRAFT_799601 [Acephala macrosclerotiorum]